MRKIAIFYHSLFLLGQPPFVLPSALAVVKEQMALLKSSGLENAALEIHCGINGGVESESIANRLLPKKSFKTYHGLDSKSENLTLVMLERWCATHSGWAVMYMHSKGATHAIQSPYAQFSTAWRNRMMRHCVTDWKTCVQDLDAHDAVGAHWLTGQGWDHSQHYFAGNCWWARSEFIATIPSIFTRQRIKDSGIGSLESRYEAEIVLGNGPRLPVIKNYYNGSIGT